MSRLPSFFTVSSGNAQLLQSVLIPRACNASRNNQLFWNARADLSNIGTIRAETIIATNFSGGTAGVIGDKTTGIAIAGDGSDIGQFDVASSNIAGFGTRVLGGYDQPLYIHGTIADVAALGASALNGACNVFNSVFVGTLAGHDASGASNTVSVGDRSGYQGQGSNNVYLGTQSGFANRGSGNVFLGSLVGVSDTTTSNTLYIGNQLGTLLYGNFSNKTLALNTDVPSANFDVSGTTRLRGTTTITASLGVNTASPTTTLDVSGTSTFRGVTIVNSSFGLNVTPSSTLDVSGNTRLRGNVIIDGDLTVSGGPIGSDVCTGQVILGIGASLSTYPSLIAVRGGLQVSEGYLQINRTEFPFQYPLDVSGNARITGSNLIGGVTLCGSGVFTSGTISGVFSNGLATSNSIAGITLGVSSGVDRIRLNASGTNGGGEIKLFNGVSTVSDTVAIFGNSFGRAGAIFIASLSAASSNGRIAGMRMDDDSNGGYLFLTNLSGTSNVELFGRGGAEAGAIALKNSNGSQTVAINGGTANGGGYFYVANSATTPTCTIYGDTGRIVNDATSVNSIGGALLSNSYLTNLSAVRVNLNRSDTDPRGTLGVDSGGGFLTLNRFTDSAVTLTLTGSSGAISNLPASSNSIGGVTLGSLTGTGLIRLGCNTSLDNGGSIQLFNSNSSNVVSINAVSNGGLLELKNSTGSSVASINGGSDGAISNSTASTNIIGGVRLSNYEVTINYPVIGSRTGITANTSDTISLTASPSGIYVASVYYSSGCNVRGGALTAIIDWDSVSAIGGGTHQSAGGGQTMAIWTSNQFVYASANSNFDFVVKRALNRYNSLP